MYAFGVHLRHANLSNIMLGISNSLFDYCNVTITLYAYILVCFLVPLASQVTPLVSATDRSHVHDSHV